MKASNFVVPGSHIVTELQDPDQKRWTQPTLIKYLNSAQRQVVILRPDATATVRTVQLVPGTRQSIPTGDLRLMEVTRNMGVAGLTPGRVITAVDKDSMDGYNELWHSRPGKTIIDHYIFDPRYPKLFFVVPAVHATTAVYVEMIVSASPTDCLNSGSDIALDDVYEGPLMDWMLYLAFMIDTESSTSVQRAQAHLRNFYQAFGLKVPADRSVNPWPPKQAGEQQGGVA